MSVYECLCGKEQRRLEPNEVEELCEPVFSLDLNTQTVDCLLSGGICTIGDLVQLTVRELIEIRNIGQIRFEKIYECLRGRDLRLGMRFVSGE